eukprot:TRINITY_DN92440_c0_g1_i1.p1 TRINITY_DN92440_c0_g1~~TRINITY_DN92440_c0_g1_i1.p1  ORF type:complete len:362 (-),score=116.36 TRINITY_DN92440_c0_g1_i1:12-1097(-)
MPNVGWAPTGAKDEDLPLLNSNVNVTFEDHRDSPRSAQSDEESESDHGKADDEEYERTRRDADEEGKYYDDPLWFGKTKEQIKYATELEKSNGNAESRKDAPDWKKANRYWKNALKGAEKLKDDDTEVRLRLNLALGYVRRHKPDKALMHCDEVLGGRLRAAATQPLRVKAHYRAAEAHELAGDDAKAIRSLRLLLQMDQANSDARQKLAQFKKQEQERRDREKELFGAKLCVEPAVGEPSVQDSEAASASPPEEEPAEEAQSEENSCSDSEVEDESDEESSGAEERARLYAKMTNKTTSDELSRRIMGGGYAGSKLNYQVGPQDFFGGLPKLKAKCSSPAAGGTADAAAKGSSDSSMGKT